MNKQEQTTPERLTLMLRTVIDEGAASGLIKPTYLDMMEWMIIQVHKNHARKQVKAALAVRQQTALIGK